MAPNWTCRRSLYLKMQSRLTQLHDTCPYKLEANFTFGVSHFPEAWFVIRIVPWQRKLDSTKKPNELNMRKDIKHSVCTRIEIINLIFVFGERVWVTAQASCRPRTRMYLMFSNWVTTGTTKKALWMKESSHAPQVIARANIPMAAIAYPANYTCANKISCTHEIQVLRDGIC